MPRFNVKKDQSSERYVIGDSFATLNVTTRNTKALAISVIAALKKSGELDAETIANIKNLLG